MSADRPDDMHPRAGPGPRDVPAGSVDLRSTVVRYESSPDRRTVYPVDVAEHHRLTRWLSADDAAFVDLDAMQ